MFAKPLLDTLMITDPDKFIKKISKHTDWLSPEKAKMYDSMDSLKDTKKLFNIGEITPFAGHSLGPVFEPVNARIDAINELQKKGLHAGHFPGEETAGNWFDCDIDLNSIEAAKKILGFEKNEEFVFTAAGLTTNLAMLMDTFYKPTRKDWQCGKTQIAILDTEFFSDQATTVSVLKRAIVTADNFECFDSQKLPNAEDLVLRLHANENGIYDSNSIIESIKKQAHTLKMLCLSDVVFSTGQRLDIPYILSELKDTIEAHNIIVGLDLAHTMGNRPIKLSELPVTFAVACAYKHLSGFAGSGCGFYVSANANLKTHPPLQGWKAADSSKVFPTINHYDAEIMCKSGAQAFRTSNTSAVAIAPAQVFLTEFNKIGFDKLFAKSECLTQYMIAQLQSKMGDNIQFITPLDSKSRGATIVIRVLGDININQLEHQLKEANEFGGQFEIDTRPPNNIRLTAHYGYTSFEDIDCMTTKLEKLISLQLEAKNSNEMTKTGTV